MDHGGGRLSPVKGNIPTMIKALEMECHSYSTLISQLLSASTANTHRKEFVSSLPDLLDRVKNDGGIISWAKRIVSDRLLTELRAMRQVPHLVGNASNIKVKTIENFDIDTIHGHMSQAAPTLSAILRLLLDIAPVRSLGKKDEDGNIITNKERDDRRQKMHHIRETTIMGILLYNGNQKSNLLQTAMGVFLHGNHVSERALSCLRQVGITDSRASIIRSIESLSQDTSEQLKATCEANCVAVAFDNFNLNFNVVEPTLVTRRRNENLTCATVYPQIDTTRAMLDCRQEVYEAKQTGQWRHASMATLLNARNNVSTILSRDERLHQAMVWHIMDILVGNVEGFTYLRKSLGKAPEVVNQIPIRKTDQYPLRGMDRDEGTLEGVIGAMEDIDKECGFPNDNSMTIYDGDLASLERTLGAQVDRSTEEGVTDLRTRCHHYIFRPGLFHLQMACADAIHRIHIEPKEARKHHLGLWGWIRYLRPQDSNRIGSKPTFRDLKNCYGYTSIATILDCWFLEAPMDLHEWAARRPEYWEVQLFAYVIYMKHVSHPDNPLSQDTIFANQLILHRDLLLYRELSHSMNSGDIGRVQDTLPMWIGIWRGVGKHKYATHIHQFLTDLEFNYTPELSNSLEMNWMVNPTGKEHAFRAVDWVVEHNNLNIKVMFGNSPTNRTVQNVLDNANMIVLYRKVFYIYDENYQTIARTIRHSAPDMKPTLSFLQDTMRGGGANIENILRNGGYRVQDALLNGMHKLRTVGDDEDEGEYEIDLQLKTDEDRASGLSE